MIPQGLPILHSRRENRQTVITYNTHFLLHMLITFSSPGLLVQDTFKQSVVSYSWRWVLGYSEKIGHCPASWALIKAQNS